MIVYNLIFSFTIGDQYRIYAETLHIDSFCNTDLYSGTQIDRPRLTNIVRFGQAKFTFDGSLLDLSQLTLLPQLSLKTIPDL